MKSQSKKILSVFLMAGILLTMYSGYSALYRYLTNRVGDNYPRSVEGSEVDYTQVDLIKLEFDPSEYIAALLGSDYLSDILGDLLNNSNLGLSAEDFLNAYGDDIQEALESFGGGGFNTSLFNNVPPQVLGIILSLPIFYMYDINTATNPVDNPEEVFFKTAAYDYYNLSGYEWTRSNGMDVVGNYNPELNTADRFVKIKFPITITSQVSQYLPFVTPEERMMEYSLNSNPDPSSGPNLKRQTYLGGMIYEAEFSSANSNQATNLTYELLYDEGRYSGGAYDGYGVVAPDVYTGSDPVVAACLKGPNGADDWSNYRATHPYFDQVCNELNSYKEFQDATTAYEKMEAILNYVGGNFTLNYNSQNIPQSGQDPLEFFCRYRETNRPFSFSTLIVALARVSGIAARYVSGYKWSQAFVPYYGGPYSDPDENGDTVYVYRLVNGYSWVEAFMPTNSTTGVWVTFDNRYNSEYTPPSYGQSGFAMPIKVNTGTGWEFYPDPSGYTRYDGALPREIKFETRVLFNGNPQNAINITVLDTTYDDRVIASNLTNAQGYTYLSVPIDSWVSGPHFLNFTMVVDNITYPGNFTTLNVLGDVELHAPNLIEPDKVDVQDSNPVINSTGYIWDPVVNEPVRNAYVNLTYHPAGNPPDVDFNPLAYTLTDSDGNFTVEADVGSLAQNNYTVYVGFNGTFSLGKFLDPYYAQDSSLRNVIPREYSAHLANGYLHKLSDNVEVVDSNYVEGTFMINGTQEGDYSATSNVPLRADRSKDTLYFNFSTWQANGWVSGTIIVRDETEGRELFTQVTSSTTGKAERYYSLSGDSPFEWTAGPHLISFNWTDCPNPTSPDKVQYVWIFIEAPVTVEVISDYYTDGSGAQPNNYSIDINNAGDPFNISGRIYDAGTFEYLANVRIHYTVQDGYSALHDEYLNWSLSELYETVSNGTNYIKFFKFVSTTPLSAAPIRTRVDFTGWWMDLGNGWDNSWNTAWESTYASTYDLSQGQILLNDPTDSKFKAWIDDVPFAPEYNETNIPSYDVDTPFTIDCQFYRQGAPQDGAKVTFYEIWDNHNDVLDVKYTDSNGNASFTYQFTLYNNTGLHRFMVEVDYNNSFIVKNQIVWVYYNLTSSPAAHFESMGRSDYDNNLTRGESESITITGFFYDNWGNGLLYAKFDMWAIYQGTGVTYAFEDYFTITSYSYNMFNGLISITFQAKSNAMLGNWTFKMGYKGLFDIPSSLNTTPFVYYTADELIGNSSTVPFTVENMPAITSSWSTNPPSTNSDDWIIGGTYLNITGTLIYDNGTGIAGQEVVIKIYNTTDHVNPTDIFMLTTDGSGNYLLENYLIEEDLSFYTVDFAGNETLYTQPAQTLYKYFS